jgi:hypothetical protein
MIKQLTERETEVKKRIRPTILKQLRSHISRKTLKLWGRKKGKNFVYEQMILALYKDLFDVGYIALNNDTKSWTGFAVKTLQHNTQVMRQALALWADEQIKLGKLGDWQCVLLHLSGCDAEVNLWIDSADFRKEGLRNVLRRSPDWSYKKNSPGRRYMALSDGRSRVRSLWGGYSPKVYDGT